jgi:hypothetical protein
VGAYDAPEFSRQSQHDVKVRYGQQKCALVLEPALGSIVPALRTGAMTT